MGFVWHWVVRAPAWAIAALFVATGALAIADWGPALMGAAFFAIIGDVAHRLGRGVKQRAKRRAEVAKGLQEAMVMRGRFSKQKESGLRKAA